MKAPARLGLYGLVLAIVFAAAAFAANAIVPESTVQSWVQQSGDHTHDTEESQMNDGTHNGHTQDEESLGLSRSKNDYLLTDISAPTENGADGELTFSITGPEGQPVTDFRLDHEQEMHLIAVRADGQYFRHVHPEKNDSGLWSIPWRWNAAGSYRIFADFVPEAESSGMTLSTTVQVAGDYVPDPADRTVTETSVGGLTVSVTGALAAGSASELVMTVERDGEAVTELEPYLGAFGHLVALRDGDLAYLHVHPHGEAPESGDTSGPEIIFNATAPTEGRYLLYLDFQVDGEVHTAPLVLDAQAPDHGEHTRSDNTEGETHGHDGQHH